MRTFHHWDVLKKVFLGHVAARVSTTDGEDGGEGGRKRLNTLVIRIHAYSRFCFLVSLCCCYRCSITSHHKSGKIHFLAHSCASLSVFIIFLLFLSAKQPTAPSRFFLLPWSLLLSETKESTLFRPSLVQYEFKILEFAFLILSHCDLEVV